MVKLRIVPMILPWKKDLYFIGVSVRILFVCICTEIPPKEIKKIINIPLMVGFVIKLVKNIPFVRSKSPFNKIYSFNGK